MADCWIGPVGYVKEIGKWILTQCLWPPIKSHVDYWWCFDSNIQGLKDGIRDLDRETLDMSHKIEEARLCTEKLRPGVEEWSNAGTEKLAEARKILQDDNFPKAWNLISRYSIGKSAKKTAEEIAKLRDDGNFNRISDPMPPLSMGSISHRQVMDFESRTQTEEEIIESLRNSSINIVGVCGMGGVGKTTMVKRIGKRLKNENLFDEVVMAVVSQQIDMHKIQKEIAELLGLNFDVESMSARAGKLRIRLMDAKRKIIIFDDVWESLKLDNLGVPFESGFERCKILLTTRSKDLCIKMEVQKVIALKVLTKEEAWSLFKEKAGNYVENLVLRSIAVDVVAECKGLPIALVTVGKALQNQRKSIWEDSLSQLRGSNPTDFPEVLTDVYKPLKLSYDNLDNERERLLFLLCCLFPEDYNIPVEHLTLYFMGLRMFDGIMTIEESRNRMHRLVEKLKGRFLLIDGPDEHHVKMHDVVRDVAIFIGSEVNHGFLKSLEVTPMYSPRENTSLSCTWMSVSISNVKMMPPVTHFPNLRLLTLWNQVSEVCYIIDIFFEGMEDLNVLSFSEIRFSSLPRTLGLLKNLRTLHLYRSSIRNISVVGELPSLEILCCFQCHLIEELPTEIGKLKRLRLLELYDCLFLQKIAFGVISSLVQLEELNICRSFRGWEAEKKGKERRNATITELQSLRNLTCLQIEIDDWSLASQEIYLSQNLVKYRIHIFNSYYYDFDQRINEKVMNLNLPRHITVGNWIHILARNTEYLSLEGAGSNNINIAKIENLRSLIFDRCSTVKKLVNTVDCKFGSVFPLLEALHLYRLAKLEVICDGTIPEGSNSFRNLKQLEVQNLPALTYLWKSPNQNVSLSNLTTISIWKCSSLCYLFSMSIAMSLLQLEVLQIQCCDTMEEVFWNEIKSITDASIVFPKLNKLTLRHLPNLIAFCQGAESIWFPKLIEIEIGYLPKLNSLFPLSSVPSHDDSSSHFLCNQKVEIANLKCLLLDKLEENISNIWCHHIPINFFRNLLVLRIINFNGIRNLMSSSIAKNLVSLNHLSIKSCREMVEVIGDEEEVADISLFPTLSWLEINSLLKLRNFCQWRHGVELPLLQTVKIDDCPRMKTFTLGSLSMPRIGCFTINQQRIDHTEDLNGAIHDFWTKSQDDDLHLNLLFGEEKEEEKQEKIRVEKEIEEEES